MISRRPSSISGLLALRRFADAVDVGAHAVARADRFARDHLVARETRFEAADFDDGVALVHALDGARDDRFVLGEEFLQDLIAFGVAKALEDDLLGVLGEAAAGRVDVDLVDFAFDEVAGLGVGEFVDDVREHFLTVGFLQALVVGDDEPAAGGFEGARVAVDVHDDVGVFPGEAGLLDGARKRHFEDAEDDAFFDVLFTSQNFNEFEHFAAIDHDDLPFKVQFGDEMGAVDVRKRERDADRIGFLFFLLRILAAARGDARRAGDVDLKVVEGHDFAPCFALEPDDAAFELAAAGFGEAFRRERRIEFHVGEFAREAFPIAGALQGTFHPGARHFETFVGNVFDRKEVRELIAHAFAVVERDAALARRVDRDADETAGEAFEFDEFIAEAFDRSFDEFRERSGIGHEEKSLPLMW